MDVERLVGFLRLAPLLGACLRGLQEAAGLPQLGVRNVALGPPSGLQVFLLGAHLLAVLVWLGRELLGGLMVGALVGLRVDVVLLHVRAGVAASQLGDRVVQLLADRVRGVVLDRVLQLGKRVLELGREAPCPS